MVKFHVKKGLKKKSTVWTIKSGSREFAFTLTEIWKAEARAKKVREKEFLRRLKKTKKRRKKR